MSDTPRTDAESPVEVFDSAGNAYDADLAPASLCRQLERELAAANERIQKLELAGEQLIKHRHGGLGYDFALALWTQAKEAKS